MFGKSIDGTRLVVNTKMAPHERLVLEEAQNLFRIYACDSVDRASHPYYLATHHGFLLSA